MKLPTTRRVMRSMLKRCLFVVLSVSLMIGAAQAANSPFVGEWKLDPSRTKLADKMKVENVSGDKYAFNFGGGVETIVVNGTDQPAGGGTTLSVTAEGGSWKVVRKKDGRAVIRAIWNLSKDGKTLKDDFTSIEPDGSVSTVHNLYERTAGTSGFAGTWETGNMRTTSVFELKVEPYEKDGLSFIYPSQGITRNVKFDGKEYPIVSPYSPPGSTSSIRRIDGQTLELTDKNKDRILNTQQIHVSSDRKTLTITLRKASLRQPNIFVFARQ